MTSVSETMPGLGLSQSRFVKAPAAHRVRYTESPAATCFCAGGTVGMTIEYFSIFSD
jgi:hypothetical protein